MNVRAFVAAALAALLFAAVPVQAAPPSCRDHLCPPPPPAIAMGRLITTGFEGNDPSGSIDGAISGGSVSAAIVRSGALSYRVDATAASLSQAVWSFTGATARDYYLRVFMYIDTAPDWTTVTQSHIQINAGSGQVAIKLTSSQTLQLFADDGSTRVQVGSDSAALNVGQWYRIELHVRINAGSNDDTAEMRVDGVSVASTTTANIGTTAPSQAAIFISDHTSTGATQGLLYFDDVALNDDQGASQNSWPGDGHVVLLKPTALSAGGTGWTDDNASSTAANLLNAVDNTPPKGSADTTSGGGDHQDRNATSNANSNLDMTMTTYTAAGIPAGSTVNVIDPITATGAPVQTSAKQGTVGVASNPAITNVALGAGGTSGAFWSGTAAGTYPSGWKISHGTITYAPSVTLGTAPVMRVTQVTSSTRIAMVCFMGMYVDYTPPGFVITTSRMIKQAANRASTY